MKHRFVVTCIAVGAVCCGAFQLNGIAFGEQREPISTIRKAAIAKLQSKLGVLRGTIKPKAHGVYLTDAMIEQLKPIRPGEFVMLRPSNGQSQQVLESTDKVFHEVEEPTRVSTGYSNAQLLALANKSSNRSQRVRNEIFKSVGLQTSGSLYADNMVTNSISSSASKSKLPNTSDMDTLVRAVDKMVSDAN